MMMTAANRDDTKRVVDIVRENALACATGEEARDLALNFVHAAAAALVETCGHGFTADFLEKLIACIDADAKAKRARAAN